MMRLHEDVIEAARQNAQDISGEAGLAALAMQLKDKRIVMLGEATHGTSEFYRLRAALSEVLIRDHGFDFVAVEGDWPDATRLRKYIQESEGENATEVLKSIHRWPLWMWANEEVSDFAETVKQYRPGFYGLDVYSLFESIHEVVTYLKKANPLLARRVALRYACFEPFRGNEIAYAKSLLGDPKGCEQEVIENLEDLLRLRLLDPDKKSEALFDAQQNARIVKNAEDYYRTMLRGDTSSWNSRDEHMLETLEMILEHHGPSSKAIIWAHNSHIGDYRATDMWSEGYVNLGGLARQHFGAREVSLVGFGTYSGTVIAAKAWGAPETVMTLPPALPGSMEDCLHLAAQRKGLGSYFLTLNPDNSENRAGAFSEILGHRAVGVVYDPLHERRGQYVPTSLSERYDAFVFIDQTNAVRPLHGIAEHGEIPETWPVGQ